MSEMDQKLPLISIIVPIYNSKKYLDKCILSIVSQTYENLEIILVDDGSTDGSGKMCDLWAKNDKRIHVFHKKNEGLVSARKIGITISKGRYIAHVDSDDWVEAEMYQQMVSLAVKNNAEVVTSGILRDYRKHTVIEYEAIQAGVYENEKLENGFWPHIISTDCFYKTNINIHITNKLIKRELALKHQMEISDKIKIGEDAAVVYPVLFDAKCIVVTGKAYYHYVIHPNSMMKEHNSSENGCDEIEQRFKRFIDEKRDEIPTIEKQLARVLLYIRFFESPEKMFGVLGNKIGLFENINQNEKVIVYGAGQFGKRVYEYLKKTNYCNVVKWCDKVTGDQVVSIEEALKSEFDKIIIAVLISDLAEEIERMLMDKGISKEKIRRMGPNDYV